MHVFHFRIFITSSVFIFTAKSTDDVEKTPQLMDAPSESIEIPLESRESERLPAISLDEGGDEGEYFDYD